MNDEIEKLAAFQHAAWAHWTKHMLGVLHKEARGADGRCLACGSPDPEDHAGGCSVGRWMRQIETPYHDLTEKEKDSDREWARKALTALLPWAPPPDLYKRAESFDSEIEEAFQAGARAFMTADTVARPFQEKALPEAFSEWRGRKKGVVCPHCRTAGTPFPDETPVLCGNCGAEISK